MTRLSTPKRASLRERTALVIQRQLDSPPIAGWRLGHAADQGIDQRQIQRFRPRPYDNRAEVGATTQRGSPVLPRRRGPGGRRNKRWRRPHPAWYLNLVSTETAKIEVGGRKLDVVATQLSGADAARWLRIVERAPDYKRNTRAAGRTFPILRLTAA